MMKKILWGTALLIALFASFSAGLWEASRHSDIWRFSDAGTPARSGEEFALSDDLIVELEERAQHGDLSAMKTLHLHYAFNEGDDVKADFWERARAQAGDTFGQSAVLKTYLESPDPSERKEGASLCAEWLEKPLAKQAD